MYVGATQDSFPHALALSKMGYNAFALIYRSGTDTAMEELAKASRRIKNRYDRLFCLGRFCGR